MATIIDMVVLHGVIGAIHRYAVFNVVYGTVSYFYKRPPAIYTSACIVKPVRCRPVDYCGISFTVNITVFKHYAVCYRGCIIFYIDYKPLVTPSARVVCRAYVKVTKLDIGNGVEEYTAKRR
jgi:hypothetical protein